MERKIPSITNNLKSPTLIHQNSGIQADVFTPNYHNSRISVQKQKIRDPKLSNSLHLVNGKNSLMSRKQIEKQRKENFASLNIACSFNTDGSSPIQKINYDEGFGKGLLGKSTFSSIQSLCDFSVKNIEQDNQVQIEKEDTSLTCQPIQTSTVELKQAQTLPSDLQLQVDSVIQRFQNRTSKNLMDPPQLQGRSNSSSLDQKTGASIQRSESKKSTFAPQNAQNQVNKSRRNSSAEGGQVNNYNRPKMGEDELGNQITDQSTYSAQQASYKRSEEIMMYQLDKSKYLVEKYSDLLEKQEKEYKDRIEDQKNQIELLKSLLRQQEQKNKPEMVDKTNALIQALANSTLEIDELKHQRVPLSQFEQVTKELNMKIDLTKKLQQENLSLQEKLKEQETMIKNLQKRVKLLQDKQLPSITNQSTSFLVHKLYLEKQEYEDLLEQLVKERDELKTLHRIRMKRDSIENFCQDVTYQNIEFPNMYVI